MDWDQQSPSPSEKDYDDDEEYCHSDEQDQQFTNCDQDDDENQNSHNHDGDGDSQEEDWINQDIKNMDFQSKMQYYRKLLQELSKDQKEYLRDIKKEASVRYYKQQFKFDKLVKDIYNFELTLNARKLFENLQRQFSKHKFSLCQCKIQTYVKDPADRQKKYEAKLDRISRQIENILRRDSYHESYVQMEQQSNYTSIPISYSKPQFVHVTVKIAKKEDDQQEVKRLKKARIMPSIGDKYVLLNLQDPKWKNKDYLNVSNNSYCNVLRKWDIGCRIKTQERQTYYSYFQPGGEHFVTFSRSMNLSQDQSQQDSNIHEICVYTSFSTSIVLRTVIKKEQIYLLSSSSSKEDVYIYLSSPPIYQFAIIPPNTFCLPNYLNQWERVENFLFLRHKDFKDNDFLRLFLYSNSYIHIELDQRDLQSFKNISMDIKLLQRQLRCNNQILSANIQHTIKLPPSLQPFSIGHINKALDFINYKDQPKLTAHIKWKLKYQIMLLVRFNVVGPGEINELLQLLQRRSDKLDYLLDFLSRKSSGYTNKVAGLNRFRSHPFEKLKDRIQEYFQQKLSNKSMNYQPRYFEHSCLIYKVSLTPSGILPNPISHQTKCRLIRHYEKYTEFFVKITLLDDVNQTMKNQKYLYNKILRKLLDRIKVMDKEYVPLGWSGSQLRGSSIWYVNQIHQKEGDFQIMTQQSILQFLGDFSEIRVAAKKAARIGQAFSSSFYYNSQDVQQIVEEDDVSKKQFLFTDGIGKISSQLFNEISKRFAKKYHIFFNCCLQIRYKGAKGVLLLNQQLKGRTIVLRNSMIKYKCNDPAAKKYLDILSWDKYLPGYLNKQTIILLKSLGISDQAFIDLQRKYIKDLNNLEFQDGNLFKIFNDTDSGKDSFSLMISSLIKHFDISKDLFFQQLLESIKENKLIELKTKTRILVEKSARLIGVIDDYGVLEEGQLYCCIKKRDIKPKEVLKEAEKKRREGVQQQQEAISLKEESSYVVKGGVIITRNPALSPADVRKCKCISLQEVGRRLKHKGFSSNPYERFMNCIVFPKKGPIPLTAQISGSDLDGDIFFICWDEKFIIQRHQPCETIDDPNKKNSAYIGQAEYRQMLNFFVEFANNEKLGRISNAFIVHADSSPDFAKNQNCKILAKIHAKAVDYGKSGELPEEIPYELFIRQFPDFMQKWNKPMYQSESVLGQLYRQSKAEIMKRQEDKIKSELRFQEKLINMLPIAKIKKKEIKEVIQQLKRFQQEVTDLLNRSNVKNQFELYTGSSPENEQLRNQFGRKRLVDWLQDLISKYQFQFFGSNLELNVYKKLKNFRSRKSKVFKDQFTQKAVLAYVITYFCFCLNQDPDVACNFKEEMKKFLLKVQQVQQYCNYEGLYLGYVWLIVPKIMIYLKSGDFQKLKEKPKKKVQEPQEKKLIQNVSVAKDYESKVKTQSLLNSKEPIQKTNQ